MKIHLIKYQDDGKPDLFWSHTEQAWLLLTDSPTVYDEAGPAQYELPEGGEWVGFEVSQVPCLHCEGVEA